MKLKALLWFLGAGVFLAGLYYLLCLKTATDWLDPSFDLLIGDQSFRAEAWLVWIAFGVSGYFLIYLLRAAFSLFGNNSVNNVLLFTSVILASAFAGLIYLAVRSNLMGIKVGYPMPHEYESGILSVPAPGSPDGWVLGTVLYAKLAFFVLLLLVTIYRTGANDARQKG